MDTSRRYSGRKFVTAMVWGLIWTALRCYDRLPPEAYVTLMWVSVGGYLMADVAEKWLVPPERR